MTREMITLQIPAEHNTTDVSFGGENYTVQEGLVTVPLAAAEHLYQFGFTNVPPQESIGSDTTQKPNSKEKAK